MNEAQNMNEAQKMNEARNMKALNLEKRDAKGANRVLPRVRAAMVAALLIIVIAPVTMSQTAMSKTAKKPEPFAAYWTRFKAALAKDDRQAVAGMTRFRDGDNTYLSDKAFLAQWYRELRKEQRCFSRQKPVKDQEAYMVFCGERIFIFNLIDGEWKFTEIGAND